MHAAVLFLCDTDERASLGSDLSDGLPAAETEATQYLDGATIHHGTLAGTYTTTQTQVFADEFITAEQVETTAEVAADFYADLSKGWAGVETGKAASVLGRYLVSEASITPQPAVVRLDSWVEEYGRRDDADVWSVAHAGEDEAAARFHDAARLSSVPSQGVSAFGFTYQWDGRPMRGMLATSGYVALYTDVAVETFAKWVAEEIRPYLDLPDDEQAELGGDSE